MAIDDFSRELFAAILPDKTRYLSEKFLKQVIDECAYAIEQAYSDNGTEYRGNPERVIRTLMEMWHGKTVFKNRAHRKTELVRFLNHYNTVKPHKGIENMTPMEKLLRYFYPEHL